jgi:hypothetical protein
MAIMWVMQPSVYEVVDVITVRHSLVSAVRPMRVRAPRVGRATRRIGVADLNDMFVDMTSMHMMQMTVVEVIDMAMMAHGRVSAVRTMLVGMIRMMLLVAGGHGGCSSIWRLVWWPWQTRDRANCGTRPERTGKAGIAGHQRTRA